jgi:hypothetical protein
MTAKERQLIERLKIENMDLREAINKHLRIYGEQLVEIIELKAKLELIAQALEGCR